MGVRKNSFVVNSIISYFPVKWEVFLLNFFRRQSCVHRFTTFVAHALSTPYNK